jgi:hypothetical protein
MMGTLDEEEWDQEDLFKTVDELCHLNKGGGVLNAILRPPNNSPASLPTSSLPHKPLLLVPLGSKLSGSKQPGLSGVEKRGKEVKAVNSFGVTQTGNVIQPEIFSKRLDKGGIGSPREALRVKDNNHKRTVRAWKPKKSRRRLVIGMDVGLAETCRLSLCALVGRIANKTRSAITLGEWMKKAWVPIIGYSPEFSLLPCGWFGLIFKSPEDAELIRGGFWDFEGGSLMLKRWRTGFDPYKDYFSYRHVWVLLPGLSLNLWNKPALSAIGNLLGRFLKLDEVGLRSEDKRMARILVELDLHAGLMDSIEIEWRGQVVIQKLDYQGLPFWCLNCRRTGHLRKDCTLGAGAFSFDDLSDTETPFEYMSEDSPDAQGDGVTGCLDDDPTLDSNSFLGKLKSYCPNFFSETFIMGMRFLGFFLFECLPFCGYWGCFTFGGTDWPGHYGRSGLLGLSLIG